MIIINHDKPKAERYFVINKDGVIENIIVAEFDFIKNLDCFSYLLKVEPEHKISVGWFINDEGDFVPPQET